MLKPVIANKPKLPEISRLIDSGKVPIIKVKVKKLTKIFCWPAPGISAIITACLRKFR